MHINAQTKIAALLKEHPDALETIVALSPDFKKLRNPVLRKLMAGRTSIGMAAKIGGVKPEDFFRALAPLGFEWDEHSLTIEKSDMIAETLLPPFLQSLEPANLVSLDVRPVLAAGDDPLKLIQQTAKELQPGQVLRIVNTFEPTPLIKLLEKQGFRAHVDWLEKNLVETYFYKVSEGMAQAPDATTATADDWEQLLKRHQEKLIELDVRHLEMPGPMMTILETLDKLSTGSALFVHHKRVPVYLLSELNDRGFSFRIKEEGAGQVKLIIFRSEA